MMIIIMIIIIIIIIILLIIMIIILLLLLLLLLLLFITIVKPPLTKPSFVNSRQATLVVTSISGVGSDFRVSTPDGHSPAGDMPFFAAGPASPGSALEASGGSAAVDSAAALRETYPSARASLRAEDPAPPEARRSRPHPAMAAAPARSPAVGAALPSRQSLEDEAEQLCRMAELVEASVASEQAVVRALEEELRADDGARGPGSAAGSLGSALPGDGALLEALAGKAEATEGEVALLEARFEARERELRGREEEVASQQRRIDALLKTRGTEEAAVDDASTEARDLASELKGCRRACGSLESEIASEEARAASLRDALEGRQARFATAEMAARNAELSTMRAARRRVAAEASAREEATALEEAKGAQGLLRVGISARAEALSAEIAEVRAEIRLVREAPSEAASAGAGPNRDALPAQARAGVEAALSVLRQQLAASEQECQEELRAESAAAASWPAAAACHGSAEGDAEVARRDARLQGELRALQDAAGRRAGAVLADGALAARSWRRARDVGAELAETSAALTRRRATEAQGGSGVVAALRLALADAEEREARRY